MKRPKPSRPHPRQQGFTLIELMVVVIIIGVSAALAMPSILTQMRQRRLRENALSVAEIYTNARMRAMNRGGAVVVQYTAGAGFTVLESIDGAAVAAARNAPTCANEPGLGCLANDWTGATGTTRQVDSTFLPSADIDIAAADTAGKATNSFAVCFTPMGRTFMSGAANAAPSQPMAGTPVFTFKRTGASTGGYQYYVAVLPNGVARLTRGEAVLQ